MKLITVGSTRYQVFREVHNPDMKKVNLLKDHYKEIYGDFFMIRGNQGQKEHYLFCRSVIDAEYIEMEINHEKK